MGKPGRPPLAFNGVIELRHATWDDDKPSHYFRTISELLKDPVLIDEKVTRRMVNRCVKISVKTGIYEMTRSGWCILFSPTKPNHASESV